MNQLRDLIIGCAQKTKAFRLTYPKAYEGVDQYTPPKLISSLLAMAIHDVESTFTKVIHEDEDVKISNSSKATFRPICQMITKKMPMFFVTKDMTAAVSRTDCKEEIDWRAINLPFEAGVFVFPRGTLVHPVHGECGWIGWGRSRSNIAYPIEGFQSSKLLVNRWDSFCFFTVAHQDPNVPWLHFNLTSNDGFCPSNLNANDIVSNSPQIEKSSPLDCDMAQSDTEFTSQMVKMCFNLFLIMGCRPELVKPGSMNKRISKKGKNLEYWQPNIVGNQYRVRYVNSKEAGDGGLARQPHWVRGHARNQACGTQWSQRKTIWIEPYWVGPT